MTIPAYKIYAVCYATLNGSSSAFYLGGDPNERHLLTNYYIWAVVGSNRSFVVDTGCDEPLMTRRKRNFLRCPGEGLRQVGIDPHSVEDVIVTHLHYDHAGNHDLFPRARYHLQEMEMSYACGRHMSSVDLGGPYEADNVAAMVRKVYAGRVNFVDGQSELAPGISLHLVGGHSKGLQVVRVFTERGWVVLASDSVALYENFTLRRAAATVYNVAEMLETYTILEHLADTPNHIIPGHDALVFDRYPAAGEGLEGIAHRIDVPPH